MTKLVIAGNFETEVKCNYTVSNEGVFSLLTLEGINETTGEKLKVTFRNVTLEEVQHELFHKASTLVEFEDGTFGKRQIVAEMLKHVMTNFVMM